MTLSERISKAIGDNVSAFSRESGLGESLLRQYIAGSKPGLDKAAAIAKAGKVNLLWLATGEGPMSMSADTNASVQSELSDFALIPGYNVQVSAGNGSIPVNEEPTRRLAFRHRWLKYRGLNEKDLVMVFTKGDSMEPTIADNNTLMVDTSDTDPQDGGIYVIRNDGHLLVKRTQIAPGQGVWLISDNKEYDKLLVQFDKTEDLEVIGKVVWIGKDI
tara:strand:- start:249 stop:899 length:651 start_codon:yes stop_codon:yes gene_type:complete